MKRLPKPDQDPPGSGRSWVEAAPDIITTVLGVGLVIFALFGFWIAGDVARPTGDPNPVIASAERELIPFKFILTWLVLFGPFFWLGTALLRSTFRKNYGVSRLWGLVGTINQILPAWLAHSRYGRMASQFQGYEMEKPAVPAPPPPHEPMDEETVRRIDRAGYLAARALGVIVGGLLMTVGVAGLLLELFETYGSAPVYSPVRLSVAFAFFCLAVTGLGFVVLRDTFRPERRAWLEPLRMFTYIVGLRAVHDIVKREHEQQAGARTLEGQGPQKALGPPPDAPGGEGAAR